MDSYPSVTYLQESEMSCSQEGHCASCRVIENRYSMIHRVVLWHFMERRKEIRYGLKAIAIFAWENAEQDRFEGEGVTGDISVSNAYIVSHNCPQRDALVQVVILLPRIPDTDLTVTIQMEARVIRVDEPSGRKKRAGFAVSSTTPGLSGFQMTCIRDDEAMTGYRAKAG